VKGSPGASHARWARMKTGLAVQGVLHVLNSTGPTPLALSQWMNALVSKFIAEVKVQNLLSDPNAHKHDQACICASFTYMNHYLMVVVCHCS